MTLSEVAVTTLLLQQAVVTGVVRDSTRLEPLAGARVTVASLAGGGEELVESTSDRHGAFVVPVVQADPGGVRVEVELPGYSPWERTFDTASEAPILVLLSALPSVLEGLVVRSDGARPGDPLSGSRDSYTVDPVLAASVPAVGEVDLLRTAELAPLASSPSDFSAMPYIRGAPTFATPVLLDGARLFNPFHLSGVISVVIAEAVDRAEVVPGVAGGGLEAGSLSGAMRVTTRDGARDRRRTAASIGVASAGIAAEGPVGGRISYLVAGRRTYLDRVIRGLELAGLVDTAFPLAFSDLYGKLTADLGGLERLSVTAYLGSEALALEAGRHFICGDGAEDDSGDGVETRSGWFGEVLDWGNGAVSARYRRKLGAAGIVDATLAHSWSRHSHADNSCGRRADPTLSGGGMRQTLAEARATWRVRRATTVAGAQATYFGADLEAEDSADIWYRPMSLDVSLGGIAAYAAVEAPLGVGFAARGGVRADHFVGLASTAAGYGELSFGVGSWSVRAAASRAHQALGSLRNEEADNAVVVSFDMLAPVERPPIPSATDLSAGLSGSLAGLRVRVDGYLRRLSDLRLTAISDERDGRAVEAPEQLMDGSGEAHGVETSLSWAQGRRFSLIGGYRWGKATYTAGSQSYIPRFHRDHEGELAPALRHGAQTWFARVSVRSGGAPRVALPRQRGAGAGHGRLPPLRSGMESARRVLHRPRVHLQPAQHRQLPREFRPQLRWLAAPGRVVPAALPED